MPNPGSPVAPGEYIKRKKKALEIVSKLEPSVKNKIKKMYTTPQSTSAVSTTQKKAVIKGTATTSRSVGGISGLGSRKVHPIYRMMGKP